MRRGPRPPAGRPAGRRRLRDVSSVPHALARAGAAARRHRPDALGAAARGRSMEVVHGLGEVQMDPTSAVARTEHLVLWSRLGKRFRVADLERLLWDERALFEYWAHIVPVDDYAIHRRVDAAVSAARCPARRDAGLLARVADARTRRSAGTCCVELRRRGPLRTRDLEDRAAEGWETGGWNDESKPHGDDARAALGAGEVMVAGRDGQQPALGSRRAKRARRPAAIVADRASRGASSRGSCGRGGVATPRQIGWTFDGRPPGGSARSTRLISEGVASRPASAT